MPQGTTALDKNAAKPSKDPWCNNENIKNLRRRLHIRENSRKLTRKKDVKPHQNNLLLDTDVPCINLLTILKD